MKNGYARAGTVAMVSAIMASLAGCGAQARPIAVPPRLSASPQYPSSPPSVSVSNSPSTSRTYTPQSTSIGIDGPNFPSITKMAMSHVSGLVKSSAEAPTIIPWSDTGSTVMYYRFATEGSRAGPVGLIESYQVTLLSPHPTDPVANFASAVFDSAAAATRDVQNEPVSLGLASPAPGGPGVAVGSGITATAGTRGSMDLLGWRQGSWVVVVGHQGSMPIRSARIVASYLRTHFMPTPEPQGAGAEGLIAVNVEHDGPHTEVAWQEGRWVYSTGTEPNATDPITTGLALALSMRRYGG